MGKLGFGGYRISIKSKTHEEALTKALELGIELIDTSSNYTNGESEELIGKCLSKKNVKRPIIVTKAGYLQGKNLKFAAQNIDLIEVNPQLKHSIHPLFLKEQITQSLERLQIDSIDYFLLHNPEYYFYKENANQDEFYQRIKMAFLYLEDEVALGRIKAYGISSNNFVLNPQTKNFVDVERIVEISTSIKADHHFKMIQFPFNLIEIGALEKFNSPLSFIDKCRMHNLITVSNRPLNAFTNNQLVRLATVPIHLNLVDPQLSEDHLNLCLKILNEKWIEQHANDGDQVVEDLKSVTLMKQFLEIWNKLPTPDAVEQIYWGHFFPFISQVWGRDLSAQESKEFYHLYDISMEFAKKNLNEKALSFRSKALEHQLVQEISANDFAQEVLLSYLNYGIDWVLVGMKKPEYVDQLKSLF